MGKIKQMQLDILEMTEEGRTPADIAVTLGIPLATVQKVLEESESLLEDLYEEEYDRFEEYNDSMDGDMESALASAGFGMDESYNLSSDDY